MAAVYLERLRGRCAIASRVDHFAGKGLHEQVLGVVDQEGGKVEERLRQMMDQQQDLGTLA